MNQLFGTLRRLAADLEREGCAWALLGGLAVSVHAEPRFTRDIDVGVAVASDREAEQLIHRLQRHGYRVHAVVEQEETGRLATARLLPPGSSAEGVIVDLLFASSGIEREIVRQAVPVEIVKGLSAPVARPGHLVALKVLARDDARRPQDLSDIRNLLPRMGKSERQRTERALRLISERGFHRKRDLLAIWASLLAEEKSSPSPKPEK